MNPSHKAWLRALELTAPIERHRSRTLPSVIDELAERFELAPALVSAAASLSYRQVVESSNRYARWGLARGLAPGDVLCLLLPNCPQYLSIWLGLSRIGVVTALLNTHLTGELLAHAINIVAPRGVITNASLAGALDAVRPRIARTVRCWWFGCGEQAQPSEPYSARDPRLERELAGIPGDPLTQGERRAPTLDTKALYIYTSGTTGPPKAVAVSHFRVMQWSHWFAGMMDTRPTDRMYDCLPLYHGVGGVVAIGATLVGGGAIVVRERFSAHQFWKDIVAERCTLFQYIGELCRYLLKSPSQPEERQHQLRLCCGNGLRSEMWEPFRSRFHIPQILEYYASTEGSVSLFNCEGRPGAIGHIPPFLPRTPVALIQLDAASEEPLRDAGGRCICCRPSEIGEAIGPLREAGGRASGGFEGYSDREASERKILRDVFAPGDVWFRSGDLMRQDAQGFFYFVDRVGDTFRWKGENVSTSEVAAVIARCQGVTGAVAYGVCVPGTEGRAGMAAITVDSTFELQKLRHHLAAHLPDYARPLFLRIVPALEHTGTFRHRKQSLAEQGYDPTVVSDATYFNDQQSQAYVKLDAPLFERICTGGLRL